MSWFENLSFSSNLSRFIAGILILIFYHSFQLVSNFPIPIHPLISNNSNWYHSFSFSHFLFFVSLFLSLIPLVSLKSHQYSQPYLIVVFLFLMDPKDLFSATLLDGECFLFFFFFIFIYLFMILSIILVPLLVYI